MITPSSHMFFFITLFLLLFIHVDSIRLTKGHHHSAPRSDLVARTCKKAAKDDPNFSYKFCVNSLKTAPKSHKADLRGLGLISMNLTRTNATHTKHHVKKLLKQEGMDPFYRSCLEACLELYTGAIDYTNDAIKYYKMKKYFDANIQISAVMDSPTTCEDGFKEKEGLKSPLTKRNGDLFQLSAIDLSIIDMLS